MGFIGILLGIFMLLVILALWIRIMFSAFVKAQEVVAETSIEEVDELDDNLQPTGKKEKAVVVQYEIDANEAERINYGKAVLMIGQAFVLVSGAAVWYFIFKDLFYL